MILTSDQLTEAIKYIETNHKVNEWFNKDDSKYFQYVLGYFDPKRKNKPADLAFRVVRVFSKFDFTLDDVKSYAMDLAIKDTQYKW